MADPRWRIQDGGNFDIKGVVTVAYDNQPIVRHKNPIKHIACTNKYL